MSQLVLGGMAKDHELIQGLLHSTKSNLYTLDSTIESRTLSLSIIYSWYQFKLELSRAHTPCATSACI